MLSRLSLLLSRLTSFNQYSSQSNFSKHREYTITFGCWFHGGYIKLYLTYFVKIRFRLTNGVRGARRSRVPPTPVGPLFLLCFFDLIYVDFWYYIMNLLTINLYINLLQHVCYLPAEKLFIFAVHILKIDEIWKSNEHSRLIRLSWPRQIELNQWRALFTRALGRSRVPSSCSCCTPL